MFKSSPLTVSLVQYLTAILAVGGIWFFDFNIQNYLLVILGYFLYSGIGISMMLHRYYTHKSFEFNNNIVKWICTFFAVVAGRGGIIGWVYIHRMHHAFSDTDKDPHMPNFNLKGMLFPTYSHFDKNINLRIVRDLLDRSYLKIDEYYNLIILAWALTLLAVSPEALYFFWIVPVALTHIVLNSFIYMGHLTGYVNYEHRDNSKNSWIYAILFWGEGWHNNHHSNPKNWSMGTKWWEIDLIAPVIRILKK
jgi:stearoyl-CoA desaturase (delta-9 desaturase)